MTTKVRIKNFGPNDVRVNGVTLKVGDEADKYVYDGTVALVEELPMPQPSEADIRLEKIRAILDAGNLPAGTAQ